MLKNYLKIAFRKLMKNKTFSFINIFGLAIGLTCCMLISLYIYNETRYDSYHKDVNRLYQVGTTFIKDEMTGEYSQYTGPDGKCHETGISGNRTNSEVAKSFR